MKYLEQVIRVVGEELTFLVLGVVGAGIVAGAFLGCGIAVRLIAEQFRGE